MWIVDFTVDKCVGKNGDSIYTHFQPFLGAKAQTFFHRERISKSGA